MFWNVDTTKKVRREVERLPESIRLIYVMLVKDMVAAGPYRANWRHYGKLRGTHDLYHCHIHSGRPTYVVCWEVKDKVIRLIEVYYVGTHENAPY